MRRLRPATLIAAGLVIAVAMLVPGCMDRQFVFDLTGPEFLSFYITAFFAALALSVIIGAIVRRRNSRAVDDPTDAYDIAMLGGGGTRVVDAALSALYAKELLSVRRDNNKGTFVKARPMRHKADLPEAEEVVYSALPKSEEVPLRDLRRAVAPAMEQMQQRLADQGLTLTVDALSVLRTWAASPFALLLVIGLNKISIGLSRKKPVAYLVILCVITLLVMMIRVARINRRTTGGEEAWQRLKNGYVPTIHARGGEVAAMSVALLGIAALQIAPGFSELHAALQRPRNLTGSSGGCGSGCGSSCGGGGCGGGGCGGGGCGGCGGGGD